MKIQELLRELDAAAAATNEAQVAYVGTTMEAMEAEERLRNCETEIAAEAADKEQHPELTNAVLRGGFVVEKMGCDLYINYRIAYYKALHSKLLAQAKYDYCRRRGNDLRIIISALKPEG